MEKKENKIKFENEEGPIQIVLNKKEEIMEEKPLVKGDIADKEDKNGDKGKGDIKEGLNTTTTYPSSTTTEDITPLEKVTAFATAIVKAITDGIIKSFVWITELFKRRRRENEIGEGENEVKEEIREENV